MERRSLARPGQAQPLVRASIIISTPRLFRPPFALSTRTLTEYLGIHYALVMAALATEEQVRAFARKSNHSDTAHSMPARNAPPSVSRQPGEVEPARSKNARVQESSAHKAYKLVSRDTKPYNTIIKFPAQPHHEPRPRHHRRPLRH